MSKSVEKCARNASSTYTSIAATNCHVKSLGVQRFCSKLRHKIEDNLTTKLCKGSRHSMSLGSLSGIAESTTGKYTNKSAKAIEAARPSSRMYGMLKHKRLATKSTQQLESEMATSPTNELPCYAGTYVDSDDEYQLPSLNWTKQSLEDEIFEELEKAAHDETKLNSVLKSFDRILTDFHEEIEKQPATLNEVPKPKSIPEPELAKTQLNVLTSSRLHSKSVLELSMPAGLLPASKIPVWKALPLSKRSNSFCSTPPASKPLPAQSRPMSLRNRAVSYTSLPRHQPQRQLKREKSTGVTAKKLIKSKTELNVKTKTKPQSRSSVTTPLTQSSKSSLSLRTQAAPGNLRRARTNSDELLDKCLEKGQQILRKIETLGAQGARLRAAANPTKLRSQQVAPQSAKKTTTERVMPVSKYLAHKGRQNSDALSDDSGHISNEADNNHGLLSESNSSATDSFCDYDTNKSTTATPTPTATTTTHNASTRSLKISQLLQKFEATSNKTPIETKSRNCTSLKVAEVEAVPCIRTQVEIFPNYSKEVTTWFY